LVDAIRRHVLTASKLHADDTPVPVLAAGNGKTKTARLWKYVRDDRPADDTTPRAVWFAYTPDRKGIHPPPLAKFEGVLQANAYVASTPCSRTARYAKRLARCTHGANSTTCTQRARRL
jgi:hypothetical protein